MSKPTNSLVGWLQSKNSSTKLVHNTGTEEPPDEVSVEKNSMMEQTETVISKNITVDIKNNQLSTKITQFIPRKTFSFPKNEKKRSCQHDWFNSHKWLHYDAQEDKVFCYECIIVYKDISNTGQEEAFIKYGINNWKKALEKFKKHELSDSHIKAVYQNNQMQKPTKIIDCLNKQALVERQNALEALKLIFSTISYLASTGQAFQGHFSDTGNFMDLLRERAKFSEPLKTWLLKRNNWLSHEIQDEIICDMSNQILRDIASDVNASLYFALIADTTTDAAGNEQLSICLRYICKNFEIFEEFVGLYNVMDTKAETLFKAIMDVCIRLILDMKKLRGHGFDGSNNMSGHKTGVKQRIIDEFPKSIFIHCSNHSLDLVLQEVARKCDMINEALSTVKDVSNLILESCKRKVAYENIVLPTNDDNRLSNIRVEQLLTLCPTRWAVRVKAIRRFRENFLRIQLTIKELLDTPGAIRDDRKPTFKGYLKRLHQFETVLSLNISELVFSPCEQLASALQSPNFTVSGAKDAANYLIQVLKNLRSEVIFNNEWDSVEKDVQKLGDYELIFLSCFQHS